MPSRMAFDHPLKVDSAGSKPARVTRTSSSRTASLGRFFDGRGNNPNSFPNSFRQRPLSSARSAQSQSAHRGLVAASAVRGRQPAAGCQRERRVARSWLATHPGWTRLCSARAVAADAWQIVHLQPGADVPNPLFVVDECPRCGTAMPATL